jgi:hypothetical protein
MYSKQARYELLRDLWILQGEVCELLVGLKALIGNGRHRRKSVSTVAAPEQCADIMDELASKLDELKCTLIYDQAKHTAFDLLFSLPEFASETAQCLEEHGQLEAALDDLVKLALRPKIPHVTALPEIRARFRQVPKTVSRHLTSFIDLVRRAMLLNHRQVEPATVS